MTIPKVNVGDSFRQHRKAETWNAFVDAANYHKMRTHPLSQSISTGDEWPCTTVLVRNNSGAARAVGEVLGLGAPIITRTDNEAEFKSRIGFIGEIPSTSAHYGNFVVLTESIPFGGIGLGAVAGVVAVQVESEVLQFTRCDVLDGDATKLLATPSGSAQILWIEDGGGTKWAYVLLGQHREASLIGKTTGSATAGGSVNVEVWLNSAQPSGYVLEDVKFDWMTGSESISLGKQVKIEWFWMERCWRITGAECED